LVLTEQEQVIPLKISRQSEELPSAYWRVKKIIKEELLPNAKQQAGIINI
jgi:hypothetical protein